jgi:hypothetical protein
VAGEPRAESLQFRLEEERPLFERAMRRPIFGWGGWNRNRRVSGDDGGQMGVTDSLWILALGQNGLVGLTAIVTTLLLAPLLVVWSIPPPQMLRSAGAAPVVLALVCVLFMIDCLLNAMINPIYLLGLGGATSLLAQHLRQPRTRPITKRAASKHTPRTEQPSYGRPRFDPN